MKTDISGLQEKLRLLSRGLRDPRKRLADSWMDLDDLQSRLARIMKLALKARRKATVGEARALMLHSPLNRIEALRQKTVFHKRSLTLLMLKALKDLRMNVSLAQEKLNSMSPVAVLDRGYSITRKLPAGWVVRSVGEVNKGDQVSVRLAEGEMECRVEKIMGD